MRESFIDDSLNLGRLNTYNLSEIQPERSTCAHNHNTGLRVCTGLRVTAQDSLILEQSDGKTNTRDRQTFCSKIINCEKQDVRR